MGRVKIVYMVVGLLFLSGVITPVIQINDANHLITIASDAHKPDLCNKEQISRQSANSYSIKKLPEDKVASLVKFYAITSLLSTLELDHTKLFSMIQLQFIRSIQSTIRDNLPLESKSTGDVDVAKFDINCDFYTFGRKNPKAPESAKGNVRRPFRAIPEEEDVFALQVIWRYDGTTNPLTEKYGRFGNVDWQIDGPQWGTAIFFSPDENGCQPEAVAFSGHAGILYCENYTNPEYYLSNFTPPDNSEDICICPTLSWSIIDEDGEELTDLKYVKGKVDITGETIAETIDFTETNSINLSEYDIYLTYEQVYHWKVRIEFNDTKDDIESSHISFVTEADPNPPYEPRDPLPGHECINVPTYTNLEWRGGDKDQYDYVYHRIIVANSKGDIENEENLLLDIETDKIRIITSSQLQKFEINPREYDPDFEFAGGQRYYWRVITTDIGDLHAVSPVWWFETAT